jgi:YVTN family beta-propeller protein
MTNNQMFRGTLPALAGIFLCTVFFSSASAQQSKLRIVQTNSAGDNIHDDKTAYVANEQSNDVSVVDIKSLKEIARIPVGFNPARNTNWMAP